MTDSKLAQNLAFLRKNRGLKQSEIQDRLGFIRNTWSNWENGKSEPNIENLLKIVDFFDIGVEELITSDLSKGKVMTGQADPKTAEKGKVKGKGTGKVMEGEGPPAKGDSDLWERVQMQKNIIDSQAKTISTLEAFNNHLNAELSRALEQIKALKREDIPISKGMEDSHKPSDRGHKKHSA